MGKDADLIIYRGNPLEVGSTIYRTIINGKVVWEE